MGISMSGSKPRPLGVACRRATQLRSKYATSQADASVAKSRRLSRRVLTRSGSGQRLSSPCCALVRDANRSSHKASSTSKCSVAAATKLLHAVSAQRKLLTSQHESRSSLQSIMGATDTRRSSEIADFATKTPIFVGFSMLRVSARFLRGSGSFRRAAGTDRYEE